MPLWKFDRSASLEDPRWLDHAIWKDVVVRAPTAAVARVVASELDRGRHARSVGNESVVSRSGLADEKLYRVRRLSDEEAAELAEEEGPNEVLLSVKAAEAEVS